MKRLALALVLCLIASIASATTVDTRVSGNTIYMNNGIQVISFNTVTNRIIFWNQGNTDIYADLRCYNPADGKSGHATSLSCVVLLPAFGSITPNTVDLNFATRNLGFVGITGKSGAGSKVTYVVTGDHGDF